MPFYRSILKKAWQICWKIRFLWFFGLFAALLGNAGEYEILTRAINSGGNTALFPGLQSIVRTGIFSGQGINNIFHVAATDPVNFFLIVIFCLLSLAVIIFLVWLVIISQAALVSASAKIFQNQKTFFREALKSGREKFWSVFLLNAFNRVIFGVVFLLLFLPAVMSFDLAGLAYFFTFIIFVPLSIFISFIIKYSIGYAVIKSQGVFEALASGWRLFKSNWLISIEMSLLLALVNFGLGLAAVLVILILAVPVLFLATVFLKIGTLAGFWVILFIGLVLFVGLALLTGAVLATFQISAWTGLFLELVKGNGTSKLSRLFGKTKKSFTTPVGE